MPQRICSECCCHSCCCLYFCYCCPIFLYVCTCTYMYLYWVHLAEFAFQTDHYTLIINAEQECGIYTSATCTTYATGRQTGNANCKNTKRPKTFRLRWKYPRHANAQTHTHKHVQLYADKEARHLPFSLYHFGILAHIRVFPVPRHSPFAILCFYISPLPFTIYAHINLAIKINIFALARAHTLFQPTSHRRADIEVRIRAYQTMHSTCPLLGAPSM